MNKSTINKIRALEHWSIIPLNTPSRCHPIRVYRNVVVDQTEIIKILHVDDDMSQGEFLKYFLPVADGTFSINAVNDPNQALKVLRASRYDCVVTDYVMPKLNGIELAAMIKKEFDVPIIIYTGQGSEEVAEAAFSVGIDDYMRKEMDPSHYQVLAKRIRSVVEKKRIDVLYKTVIDQTRDALAIIVENKVVFANISFLKMLELSSLQDIPPNPFDFALGEDKERGIKRYQEAEQGNELKGFLKYRLKTKKGKLIHVEVSTSPITYNGKNGALCFVRDITEQEKLEADKKETQDRLSSLVELAPDGIVTFDMRGVVTSVNSAFLKISGYNQNEVLGKNFLRLKSLSSSDLKSYFIVFSNLLKGSMPPPFEFKYIKKGGSLCWGEAHVGFIEVSGKREFMAILRDITDRKQASQEEPIVKRNVLEETSIDNDLLISIGQLAYLIGTEVIDPINNIKENLEIIKRDPDKLDDIIPLTESYIDQVLLYLNAFISRTDGSYLQPGEQDLVQVISKTVETFNKGDIIVEAKHVGDLSANIDGSKLQGIIEIIIKKMVYYMKGEGKLAICSEASKSSVKVKISRMDNKPVTSTDKAFIKKLRSDSDIIICVDETRTDGGEIIFKEDKEMNPSVLITLPVKLSTGKVLGLLSYDDIAQIVKK